MEEAELIEHVKLAFYPKYQWVLFSNGTVVIIDDPTDKENLKEKALTHMKQYGPVYPGCPAGDFSTVELHDTEGWLVSVYGHGMYTYVHPQELENSNPESALIGLYGRDKRDKDSRELKIIYIKYSGAEEEDSY